MTKNYAIVLAGGSGKRMNSNIPKQFLEINDKPILYYALKAFEDSFIDEIVLVCKAGDENYCKENIIDKYGLKKVSKIVIGGKERYNSVYNGLLCIEEMKKERSDDVYDREYVYVHDGARPFVTNGILERINAAFEKYNACITAVPVKDTIKIVENDGKVEATPNREFLYQIQTPQAFEFNLLKASYDNMFEEIGKNSNLKITDDSMVVENFSNESVYIIQGDYSNIKVTTPEDMVLGNIILNKN